MSDDERREIYEVAWEDGNRHAWTYILNRALSALGYKASDPTVIAARLAAEREQTIAALRSLCRDFGDNDWKPELHLSDVIRCHLEKHLRDPARTPAEGRETDPVGQRPR